MNLRTGCACGLEHLMAAAAYERENGVRLLDPHLPECPLASAGRRRARAAELAVRIDHFDAMPEGPELEHSISAYLEIGATRLSAPAHWGPDNPRRRLCR